MNISFCGGVVGLVMVWFWLVSSLVIYDIGLFL